MKKLFFHLFSAKRLLKEVTPCGPIPETEILLGRAFRIVWPATLETFCVALVGVVDTVMVSSLGTYAIAAVGLTSQPRFLVLAPFFALSVAVSALVARRCGENDRENANKILIQVLWIAGVLMVVLSVCCVVFAGPFLRLAGSAEDTHQSAVNYFRIVMGGMGFAVISMIINAAQRGAGNTKIALKTNLVSNLVNILFNFLLIEGRCGFPKLGLFGAAIATVIGTAFAFGMSIYSVWNPKGFICLRGKVKNPLSRRNFLSIFHIASATFTEQIFMRLGFLVYAVIVAKLGTIPFAAHQIGMNIISISFAFADGLSVAAITLVGQSLGEKRPDLAQIFGGICQRMGTVCSILLAVIFITQWKSLFSFFSKDPLILDLGEKIMQLTAIIVFLQIAQVIYSGCLRGAGDAGYIALVSFISVAVIRPFSGWLFCYPFGWGVIGAWLGLTLDQFVRFLMTKLRFHTGKWMKIEI